MKIRHTILCCLFAALVGCAPALEAQAARQTLIEFFDHLANDEYDQAVDLYGGDYEQLIIFNPDLDPANRPELWRNACNFNGLQCLPVASSVLQQETGGTFTFLVEFRKPDGSLFALGPCCAATTAETPIRTQFQINVERTSQGSFLVLDLPVYIP